MGLLEKVGGWVRLTPDPFLAIIRKMHAWQDLNNYKNLMVATDLGVQILVQDTVYGLGRQANITDAKFSVTISTTEVTVLTSVLGKVGDSFILQQPISIGGRILNAGDSYTVKKVVPGGFAFDMPMPALTTESAVRGVRLFTNDIVNGMTVTWKAHGLGVGNSFTFTQTTALQLGVVGVWEQVNFTAPAGTVLVVATVPSVDTFTFVMGGFGTGNGTGTATHQVYDGSVSVNGVVTTPAMALSLSMARPIGNPQRMNWFLDNLGEDGLMLRTGGPLEVYTPPITEGPWTEVVVEAPSKSNGMFVAMPQAQVILLGTLSDLSDPTSFDPLFIRWSHVGTYTIWLAAVGNQAGSYRLSRGSKIVGGIQAPQTTLVLTDTDCWAMSYIGPPLVYGFTIMGTGCGLISEDAIGSLGRSTYWMSEKGFWQYGDGGVQPLMCSVYDYVFNDLDSVNVGKIYVAENSTTNEIAWFFPSLLTALADEADDNLLLWSQQFDEWEDVGVLPGKDVRFRLQYIYEPYYAKSGWYDDVGLMPVAWWNDDLQGVREKVIFAPDGTDTATLLMELATTGMHAVSQEISKLGQKITYTFSIYAHKTSTRNLTLRALTSFGGVFARFNVVSGVVISSGSSSPLFAVISAKVLYDDPLLQGASGAGWMRYAITFVSDAGPELELFINLTNVDQVNYLGDTTKGALIWGAQLVHGGEALDYRTTFGTQVQNECTRYVKYNTVEKAWDSGVLWRSAWIDTSVWGPPLGADINHRIQQHERGYDDDDQPMRDVFAETGYSEMGDGSVILLIDQVQPDLRWFGRDGEVTVTLKTTNYAGGPVQNHERYSMTPETQFFSVRARARYAATRYEWSPLLGFSARIGATTFRVKAAGKRP
jgi:hypothetical protein